MKLFSSKLLVTAVTVLVAGSFMVSSLEAAPARRTGKSAAQSAGKGKAAAKAEPEAPAGPHQYDVYAEQDRERLDSFIDVQERVVSDKRKDMIQSLDKILRENPWYEGKADVLFRLAELHWEEAQYHYFLDRRNYEKEYEAFLAGTVKIEPREPKPDYSVSLRFYQQILQEFPAYPRLDEVMFYLGHGLLRAGQDKEGASYFSRLVKSYPESKYLPDALLAVADYYFTNEQLFAARINYQEVLRFTDSPLYNYANYKLAWVYYNLGEWEIAIDTLKEVIEGMTGQREEQQRVQFRNQAMNDLVMVLSEVDDGWRRCLDYFMGLEGKELAWDKLTLLSQRYVAADNNEDAIEVFNYFLENDATSPKAVNWLEEIGEANKRQNDPAALEANMRRIVDYFDTRGTWAIVNKDNEEIYKEAIDLAQYSLEYVATKHHEIGQKTGDMAAYMQAAKDYELFLQRFPDSPKAYTVTFYLGEIYYYEVRDWAKAAERYLEVVRADPEGEFLEDAGYGAILAYQHIMEPESAKEQLAQHKGKLRVMRAKRGRVISDEEREIVETPLTPEEEHFIEACDAFGTWLPKSDRLPVVMFKAAEVFRKHDQLADAVKRLEMIVVHHPRHQFTGHAANSIFNANSLLKRWDEVEKWARFLIQHRNFEVRNRTELEAVIAIALSKRAEELQEEGLHDEAADKMLTLVREFPKHELAPKALFNAAAIYEAGKKTQRALDLYKQLLNQYKTSDVAPQAMFVVGAIYEDKGDFKEAADYFENMSQFRDAPETADALYNAAAIREAMEDFDGSLKALRTYLSYYPDRDDVPQVTMQVARVLEKQKAWDQAISQYQEIIKKYPSMADLVITSNMRAAKINLEEKRAAGAAVPYLAATLKVFGELDENVRKGELRHLAAEARFLQAENDFQKFMEIKYPNVNRIRAFRNAFRSKAEALAKAESAYLDVAMFGSQLWAAGGLTRIGVLYHEFAESLFNVPVPEQLSWEEQDMYRIMLEQDFAFPLQEKAIAGYQGALEFAHNNHVFNEYTRLAADNLVKLSPEAYPVIGSDLLKSNYENDILFRGEFSLDMPPEPEVQVDQEGGLNGQGATGNGAAVKGGSL